MAVPAFLLAMQRPPVLWFVTEIAVSPGTPSDFAFTVCQSCPVSEKPNVQKDYLCCLSAILCALKGGESRKSFTEYCLHSLFPVLWFISCGPETVRINPQKRIMLARQGMMFFMITCIGLQHLQLCKCNTGYFLEFKTLLQSSREQTLDFCKCIQQSGAQADFFFFTQGKFPTRLDHQPS